MSAANRLFCRWRYAGSRGGVRPTFIDVDYPSGGESSLTVFGDADRQLGKVAGYQGPNTAAVFRGVVAVDSNGELVPAIERVHLQNGGGWPGVIGGDGVLLDDIVFSTPD